MTATRKKTDSQPQINMNDMRAWIATFIAIMGLLAGLSMFVFKTNLDAERDHKILNKHGHPVQAEINKQTRDDIDEIKEQTQSTHENVIRIGERLKVHNLDRGDDNATTRRRRR